MLFSNLDIFIVGFYCVGIIILAQYVSRSQQGVEKTAEDYFLAGRSLPWWAIAATNAAKVKPSRPLGNKDIIMGYA